MGALTQRRIAQLKADRDRTRAISMYLKDHRARLESQLCQRARVNKNTRRSELVRLARVAFHQEPQSVQTHYLQMSLTTPSPGEAVVVEVQAAVQAAQPEASTMADERRRRLRVKRASSAFASGPGSTCTTAGSETAKKHRAEQQEKAPKSLGESGSRAEQTRELEGRGVGESATAMSPKKSTDASGNLMRTPQRSEPLDGVRVLTSVPASSTKENLKMSGSAARFPKCHFLETTSATTTSSKQSVGELGSEASLFLSSLPRCLPQLSRVAGPADAAEILACATRIFVKCPAAFPATSSLLLRQAVLFGMASKMTANSDNVDVAKVWGEFVRRDWSTRQQIMALEARAVNVIGRA